MISVKNLYKSFGSHQVLNDINEHIAPGEKIVIIGPSGSGKSTFLRCMNLLERPTSGQIIFDGIDITDPKTDINKVRQHMGMVFQHFNLFPHKTIMENITLAPVRLKLMKSEEAKEEVDKVLIEGTKKAREVAKETMKRTPSLKKRKTPLLKAKK